MSAFSYFGRNKFKAVRSESHGRSFASKGERDCYEYLLMLQKNGNIGEVLCQVSVRLTDAQIEYKPDFAFWCNQAKCLVHAEYKGFETPEWRIKKRLWKAYGPGPLRIYKGSGLRMKMDEEIIPKPRQTKASVPPLNDLGSDMASPCPTCGTPISHL